MVGVRSSCQWLGSNVHPQYLYHSGPNIKTFCTSILNSDGPNNLGKSGANTCRTAVARLKKQQLTAACSNACFFAALHPIRSQLAPDAAITGDVIVGFPGETEEQFQHTLDLMERVKFDNLNTFRCCIKYSSM